MFSIVLGNACQDVKGFFSIIVQDDWYPLSCCICHWGIIISLKQSTFYVNNQFKKTKSGFLGNSLINKSVNFFPAKIYSLGSDS